MLSTPGAAEAGLPTIAHNRMPPGHLVVQLLDVCQVRGRVEWSPRFCYFHSLFVLMLPSAAIFTLIVQHLPITCLPSGGPSRVAGRVAVGAQKCQHWAAGGTEGGGWSIPWVGCGMGSWVEELSGNAGLG